MCVCGPVNLSEYTHSFFEAGSVWVFGGCVSKDLFQQERVFNQPRSGNVEKAPEVQFPTEG